MKHRWIKTLALVLALMLCAGNALAGGSLLDGFFNGEDAGTTMVEAEDPGMPFQTLESVYFFEGDYGFSEDRAWVELKGEKRICLINPEGEILYEAPKSASIEAVDDYISFDRFDPVKNGVAFFSTIYGETGASVIIDANGNELARYTGDRNAIRYIAGRTDDRFLLVCIEKSAQGVTAYFVPLGMDGQPVDVPRIVSQDEYLGYFDFQSVLDLGEGVFCWNGFDRDLTFSKLYNLNNNTLQQTSEQIIRGRLYKGKAFLEVRNSSSKGRPILSIDDLQEDRVNLVFTQFSTSWRQGNFLFDDDDDGFVIHDLDGAAVARPAFSEPLFNIHASDDGYVLLVDLMNEYYSLLSPDGHYLYDGEQLNGYVEAMGRGGYAILQGNDDYQLYIVDREGVPHLLSDDLSGLPDLAELRFFGFGSGYLLEIDGHLGHTGSMEDGRTASIRSLDGKTLVTGLRRTPDTKALGDTFQAGKTPDFSAASPIGRVGGEKAQAVTTPEEIAAMGETGVIVVDDLFAPEGILLLDTEGIRLTLRNNYLEVENNNPDNKRATLYVNDILLDDLSYGDVGGGWHILSDVTMGGETGKTEVNFPSEREFMNLVAQKSAALAELPLVEIEFRFALTIGKDGEPVSYTRTLRRSDYSEELLSPLYGDPVGECEYEGKTLYRAYRVQQDSSTAIFAIRNVSDEYLFATFTWIDLLCSWYVDGEPYGDQFKLSLPPDGVTILSVGDIDAIYKEVEVANGTPLNLSLELAVPGDEMYNSVIVDMGQISN